MTCYPDGAQPYPSPVTREQYRTSREHLHLLKASRVEYSLLLHLTLQNSNSAKEVLESSYCVLDVSIKVGPWGGEGGRKWSYKPNGWITEIVIFHDGAIDSISFRSVDGNGGSEYSQKYGGNGGKSDKILLDRPTEYLTSISGTYEKFSGFVVLRSLSFQSNLTTYGPYERGTGERFSLPIESGFIVGFHGRSGGYLDALGVYLEPLTAFSTPSQHNKVMIDVPILPRDPWPWGWNGGKAWDDGVFFAIHQVSVFVKDGAIKGIQILYERTSRMFILSECHGSCVGDTHRIKVKNPIEFLVGIGGFFGPTEGSNGFEVLRSITFYTNRGKYGPFGDEIGKAITSTAMNSGKVLGFHGRSGAYLDAIGVHMEFF